MLWTMNGSDSLPLPAPDLDLLRQILDGLPLAIFLVDSDLRIHRLNEAAARSLGLDPASVIRQRTGDAIRCLNAVGAPHGCGTTEACQSCLVRSATAGALLEGHRISQTTQLAIEPAAGPTLSRTLNVTAAPLAFQGRRFVLLTLEDITELLKLRGLIPRCAWCGRMRDDEDYWQSVEEYLQTQHDVLVSHGICPDCASRMEKH